MDDSVSVAMQPPPAKDRSLEKAGLSYIVADAAQIAASLLEKTPNYASAIAATGWMAGGAVAEHYGHPSAEQQLRHFSLELGDYLKKQGITDLKGDDLRRKSVIAHAEDFLYRYPSQSLNAVYGLLAANVLRHGLRPSLNMRTKLSANEILLQYTVPGALVLSGALAGLMLPEHGKKKENGTHEGILGRAIDWAEENPLRVSATIYSGNNLIGIGEAVKRGIENPRQPSYMAKLFAAAAYLYANHNLTQSSKNGHDSRVDPKVMTALADRSAALLERMPKARCEALIAQVSGFLASRKDMTYTAPEIDTLIHQALAGREGKVPESWVEKMSAPAKAEAMQR